MIGLNPPDCNCFCDPCDNPPHGGCTEGLYSESIEKKFEDGEVPEYDTKNLGSASLTELDVSNTSGGFPGRCLKLAIKWNHTYTSQSYPTDALTQGHGVLIRFPAGGEFNFEAQQQLLTNLSLSVQARCVKLNAVPPSDADPLVPATIKIFAHPVVYQNGKTYSANGNNQEAMTLRTFAESKCWLNLGGSGVDNPSPGNGGTGAYFPRYREWVKNPKAFWASDARQTQDYFTDWDTPVLTREGYFTFGYYENYPGPTLVLQDDPDATLPPVQRYYGETPDFNGADSATFGWAIGVVGSDDGDYDVELLIDNVCLGWALSELPTPCGTLEIDEPLASFPAWGGGLSWDWGSGVTRPVPSWGIDSGLLTVKNSLRCFTGAADTIYGSRADYYARSSLFTDLTMPDRTDPNFCVTIEARLHSVSRNNMTWEMTDRAYRHAPSDIFDQNEYRPWEEFGIFIGRCARVGFRFNHPAHSTGDRNIPGQLYHGTYPNPVDCGGFAGPCLPGYIRGSYTTNSVVLTCGDLHLNGDDGDDGDGYADYGETHYCTTSLTTHFFNGPKELLNRHPIHLNPHAKCIPQSGGLVRMEITRRYATAEGHSRCPNVVPQVSYPMKVKVWVNHRPMVLVGNSIIDGNAAFTATESPVFDFLWLDENVNWITTPGPLRVGIFAKAGGRWSDFKCWVR